MSLRKNPKPRMTVNIGVTGHRWISDDPDSPLGKEVRALLLHIRTEVCKLHDKSLYAEDEPRFVLLTSLAKGADILVAKVALELDYELHVVLPMQRDVYAGDFQDEADRETLYDFLDNKCGKRIFEIEAANPERNHAYADAAEVILNHSDLLLALWDGKRTGSIAGTGATVEMASTMHLPTIHLLPDVPGTINFFNDGFSSQQWQKELSVYLISLLRPMELSPARPDRRFAGVWASQGKPLWLWKHIHLEKLLTWLIRLLPLWPHKPDQVGKYGDEGIFPQKHPQGGMHWDEVFRWFDELSNVYAAKYRSCLVLRYLAPVTAIIILIYALNTGKSGIVFCGLSLLFIFQIGFLVLPILLELLDKWRLWHRKFFSYRVVSEHIRQMSFLWATGFCHARKSERGLTSSVQQSADAGAASGKREAAVNSLRWTAWYYRAYVREKGVPVALVNRQYLLDWLAWVRNEFVAGQEGYHNRRRCKEGNVSSKLVLLGYMLLAAGIGASIWRAHLVSTGAEAQEVALAAAWALALPAIGVFCTGFCSYAGYSKNRQVSADTADTLRALRREMDLLIKSGPGAPPLVPDDPYSLPEPLHYTCVSCVARQIHNCCRDELANWEDIISTKGIKS